MKCQFEEQVYISVKVGFRKKKYTFVYCSIYARYTGRVAAAMSRHQEFSSNWIKRYRQVTQTSPILCNIK